MLSLQTVNGGDPFRRLNLSLHSKVWKTVSASDWNGYLASSRNMPQALLLALELSQVEAAGDLEGDDDRV